MAKRIGKGAATSAIELAHGGRKVSAAALRRAMGSVTTRMEAAAKARTTLYRKLAATHPTPHEPLKQRSLKNLGSSASMSSRELRAFGDLLAKRTAAPALKVHTPGILAGSISLRLTPGYDLGRITQFPNAPRNSAFVHRRTGQMGFDIFAERKGTDAFAAVSLAAIFIPTFGPARLTATINPSMTFAFWTISTGTTAMTLAMKSFRISPFRFDGTFDTNVPTTGGGFETVWFNQIGIGLEFDFGTIDNTPMHASAEVDPQHFYVISLECFGQALSAGSDRPGFTSNAGGILKASLPFIDLELQSIPVLTT